MTEMFKKINISYDLRDNSVLTEHIYFLNTSGLNTSSYYGAHIWNILLNDLKKCTSINSFKEMIKKWKGPKMSMLNV